jgi:hypothetical protein
MENDVALIFLKVAVVGTVFVVDLNDHPTQRELEIIVPQHPGLVEYGG